MQPASCGMSSFKQEPMAQTKNHNQSLTQCVDLPEVFEYLGLSKYTDVFVQQEVNISSFLVENFSRKFLVSKKSNANFSIFGQNFSKFLISKFKRFFRLTFKRFYR